MRAACGARETFAPVRRVTQEMHAEVWGDTRCRSRGGTRRERKECEREREMCRRCTQRFEATPVVEPVEEHGEREREKRERERER